jgi:hypothetical protein
MKGLALGLAGIAKPSPLHSKWHSVVTTNMQTIREPVIQEIPTTRIQHLGAGYHAILSVGVLNFMASFTLG